MIGFRDRHSEKMYFRYKAERFRNDEGKEITVKKPRVEVCIRKDSGHPDPEKNPEYRAYFTVDSGADLTFLPRQIAEIIGLELNENKKDSVMTIAGKSFAYQTEAYMEIMYQRRRVPIGFVPILVTEGDASQEYIERLLVVGREGFFDKFIVTFNEAEKNFELRKFQFREKVKRF